MVYIFKKILQVIGVLGCTPQVYKAYTYPVLRPRKEPRVSNRDISGLMDGGAYMSEAKVLERHPTVCSGQGGGMVGRTWWQSSLPGGRGGCQL